MVSRKTNKGKAVRKRHNNIVRFLVFIVLVAIVVVVAIFLFTKHPQEEAAQTEQSKGESAEEPKQSMADLPARIDFQTVVDEWAKSTGGNRSVLIYDLDRNELVGKYNQNENYNTASIYKLFVVYEGYRRVQSGEWKADESAGMTGYTVLECLDKAIRESYSPCAEALWVRIGYDELEGIIERDFDIHDSDISDLVSNPNDILKMMQIFYEHKDITDDVLLARMKDSFLNQPATEYDWRQGLPSGFTNANVYNKVGWDYNPDGGYWNIYHDAAIVEFPEQNRHYIVVVMTNMVSFKKIRELGTAIEAEFNKY